MLRDVYLDKELCNNAHIQNILHLLGQKTSYSMLLCIENAF